MNIHAERLTAMMAVMLDEEIPYEERLQLGQAISDMSDEEITALAEEGDEDEPGLDPDDEPLDDDEILEE